MARAKNNSSSPILVYVTTKNMQQAKKIGASLVSEGLAACVNILSTMQSIYRWQGKIVQDKEALLLVKTTRHQYKRVEARVKQLHTYTNPCIVWYEIKGGSREYLKWLSGQ